MVVLQTGDQVAPVDAQGLHLPDVLQVPPAAQVRNQEQVATDVVDE